ncbi:MAG: proline--tRNA ligase [Candidatus Woesearchaeota archaeon]|jgi:prolyl-tRNA synthetase
MAKDDKANDLGITVKKEENSSEWYSQVITKAKLADYSPIKGCMIIRANGYSIWEKIQEYFNSRLSDLKVDNYYFPLFIPESFFSREAEHAKGFSPEVAWIETKDNEERLAIRPTSETIICDSFSKWVRSYRDLPLRTNQWANIVRWEVKQTNPFLRSREFLWQEGHSIYETLEEAEKETFMMLEEYRKLAEDVLAMPVIYGKKADSEKFAGADYTTTIEAIMPDGKALQSGTSHLLGQGFMKVFNVKFKGRDEKEHTPYYISWGFSTRLIGGVIMTHGDNKGMVLPPKLAKHKIVIVPILFKGKEQIVLDKAKELFELLKENNPILDDRLDISTGFKYNEWELQGIPLRIEIGPRDVEGGNVVLVRRDTGHKEIIAIEKLAHTIKKTLENMQNDLYTVAKKRLDASIVICKNIDEIKKAIENKKLVKISWCGERICEEYIYEKSGASSRCIPLSDETPDDKYCAYCQKDAKVNIYFSRSY